MSNTGREKEGKGEGNEEGGKKDRKGREGKTGEKTAGYSIPSARRGAECWQRDDARGNSRFVQEPVDVPTRRQAGTHRSANRAAGALSALHNVAAADDSVDDESFPRKLDNVNDKCVIVIEKEKK